MQPMIDVNTVVTPALYREMVYFNILKKKKYTIPFMIVAGMIAAFNIVARLAGIYDAGNFLFYTSILYFFILLIAGVSTEYQIRKFVAADKTVIGHEHRITVDEQGVTSTSATDKASFSFEQLYQIHETKKSFLMFINTMQAITLPKIDLSDEQVQALSGLFAQKMGKQYIQH